MEEEQFTQQQEARPRPVIRIRRWMINVFLLAIVPLVILIIFFIGSYRTQDVAQLMAGIWLGLAVIYFITAIVRRVLAVDENKRKRAKSLASSIVNLVISIVLLVLLGLVHSSFGVGMGGTLSGGSMPSAGMGGGGGYSRMATTTSSDSSGGLMRGSRSSSSMPYRNERRASIDDAREFMKITYDADIATRNVSERADDVEDLIDDVQGRIDQKNVTNDYAYFAVAFTKLGYEEFRDELEDIIPTKFLEERVVEVNKLPEKQAIEREYDQLSQELADARSRRQQQTVEKSSMNTELRNAYNELEDILFSIYDEIDATPDDEEETLTVLILQALAIESMMYDLATARYESSAAYDNKLAALQKEIEQYEARLEDNQERETELIQDVRTVDATVTINQISVWKAFQKVSPIPVGIWIALLALLLVGGIFASGPRLPRIEIE